MKWHNCMWIILTMATVIFSRDMIIVWWLLHMFWCKRNYFLKRNVLCHVWFHYLIFYFDNPSQSSCFAKGYPKHYHDLCNVGDDHNEETHLNSQYLLAYVCNIIGNGKIHWVPRKSYMELNILYISRIKCLILKELQWIFLFM